MTVNQQPYRCADTGVLRAAAFADLPLPAWPDLAANERPAIDDLRRWIAAVWAIEALAAAVEHASPGLASDVESLSPEASPRQVRRVARSLARYALRMTGRATPFGLFAGVASLSSGPTPSMCWGSEHRLVSRPDASWLSRLVAQLEGCPPLLGRLHVVTNGTAFVRGDRLVVPFPSRPGAAGTPPRAEVSLRHTSAVRLALDAARTPVRCDDLGRQLAESIPGAAPDETAGLVTELVHQGALVSSLHAPSTTVDAFRHLMGELEVAAAADLAEVTDLMAELRGLRATLDCHNLATPPTRHARRAVVTTMAAIVPEAQRPLAVDMGLDCTAVLPPPVQRAAEAAVALLVRLSAQPTGTAAWRAYHDRFFERYGLGSLVPIKDVVDADIGLGYPAGYLGTPPSVPGPLRPRDRTLLALAQAAALDGRTEVVLDDSLVAELAPAASEHGVVPPHVELRFQLHGDSGDDLARSAFTVWVPSVSRGVGTLLGRAATVLPPDGQASVREVVADLPAADGGALPVQLSFPPLHGGDAHVARAPALLPDVVSLGEHRAPGGSVIPLDDLAVGCDRHRLYVVSLSRGQRLHPLVLHALDLRAHTPPLARFLAEIATTTSAVVTGFDWGAAAQLPYLPRLRHGCTVLSPAQWRLEPADLDRDAGAADAWHRRLAAWCERRGVPRHVQLAEGDQLLPLDLDESAHTELLRAHLASTDHAVLVEAPGEGANGWLDGHAHEVVLPMTSTAPRQAAYQPPVRARLLDRDHGHVPGASSWLHAKLYGAAERQPTVIGCRFPELMALWDEPPTWWFTRYGDPEPHIRLRVALADDADFGPAVQRVGRWARTLRREGLLRDVHFVTTYPEEGRWGAGLALAAAEAVFAADSACVATQFAQRAAPQRQALAAANFVAIACAFSGGVDAGMDWLVEHARTATAPALPRPVLGDAVRLADPRDAWAALRDAAGGPAIVESWALRDQALAAYRSEVDQSGDAVDVDLVLESLLHTHHIRATGIDKDDERTCVRLARAAALAWHARDDGDGGR